MPSIFALGIHIIILLLLCTAIGLISGILCYFLCKDGNRISKSILSFFTPFIGLFSFYFLCLVGAFVISESKQVDIGFGDTWYVPITNDIRLLFIDLPEQAFIEDGGRTIISDVSQIAHNNDMIFGETHENTYFAYDLISQKLAKFKDKTEFQRNYPMIPKLIDAADYYRKRREELTGSWINIIAISALIISILIVFLVWKTFFGAISIWRSSSQL